jgi:hypothetical protein
MKITFQYTEDEYVKSCWLHTKGKLNPKLDATIALACVVFGIWSIVEGNKFTGWALLGLVIFLVGIVAISRYVVPKYIYRKSIVGKSVYNFEFSEQGIHYTTETIDSQFEWPMFTKVLKGPDQFLLYHGKNQFIIIPKRAFRSTEDLNSFDLLLTKVVSPTTN